MSDEKVDLRIYAWKESFGFAGSPDRKHRGVFIHLHQLQVAGYQGQPAAGLTSGPPLTRRAMCKAALAPITWS
jgi:hypothetical protein